MKYTCALCGDLCFDGCIDLKYDVACHEMGENHRGKIKSILGEKRYIGHDNA